MDRKQAYAQKMEGHLDEWRAEIEKLEAKAKQAQGDAKVEYHRVVDELRAQQEIASHKLANFQKSSDGAWEDLKLGVDRAWKNLGTAVDTAASRFE